MHLGHNNNREPATGDTIGKGDNGLFSPVGFCTPSGLDTIGDTVSESEVTNYISLQVDMDLEERKRALRQSIASLKQKVEEQEDDELCQLMEVERQLKAKLHQGEGLAPGTGGNVNKIHTEKLAIKDESSRAQAELQNLIGLKFDMTGFLGSDLNARPSELKGVYSLAEREAQAVAQAKRSKGSKLVVKKRRHEEEGSSDSLDPDMSDSDDKVEMVKVKPGTSGKGKKVISGRYERVGNSKLVSNEWYAHTALDEAMGERRNSRI